MATAILPINQDEERKNWLKQTYGIPVNLSALPQNQLPMYSIQDIYNTLVAPLNAMISDYLQRTYKGGGALSDFINRSVASYGITGFNFDDFRRDMMTKWFFKYGNPFATTFQQTAIPLIQMSKLLIEQQLGQGELDYKYKALDTTKGLKEQELDILRKRYYIDPALMGEFIRALGGY